MTLRGGPLWLVLFAVAACGGRSREVSPLIGAGGDPPTSQISDAGEPGVSGEPSSAGGSSTSDWSSTSGEGGTAGDGGAGGDYTALIASGTRTCENADYCFGLACYAPASFYPNICLARCETDDNCQPSEACLRAPKLDPTCYARCKSPSDCYEGFDCYDFSGKGELVCFPRGWAGARDKLGY